MVGPRKFRSFLAKLCGKEDGTALIEFAFTFPILITMMAGLFEVMAILFVTSLIEGGVREASRFGITGLDPGGGISREQRIVDLVNRAGIGLVTATTSNVTIKTYDDFDDVGQPEPFIDAAPFNGVYDLGETYTDTNGNAQWDADMGAAGAGGAGQVVVYTVNYDWPMLTPVLTPFIGTGGKFPLQASVAVRNEPFNVPPPPVP